MRNIPITTRLRQRPPVFRYEYVLRVMGRGIRPGLHFSFQKHDFGPCFITPAGNNVHGLQLVLPCHAPPASVSPPPPPPFFLLNPRYHTCKPSIEKYVGCSKGDENCAPRTNDAAVVIHHLLGPGINSNLFDSMLENAFLPERRRRHSYKKTLLNFLAQMCCDSGVRHFLANHCICD